MPQCPHCAAALPVETAACPNCGRVISAGRTISTPNGVVLGCFAAVAAVLIWVLAAVFVLSHALPGPGCAGAWLSRAYYILTLVLCLAALIFGVRAARRGGSGVAALFIIPAVVVLVPATPCTVLAFTTC